MGYFDLIGAPDIDYVDTTTTLGSFNDHFHRSSDFVSTRRSIDSPRLKFSTNGLPEVHVALVQTNEWLNYTRTFPPTNYNVYLRYSSTADQQIRLDRVVSDRTQMNQTTTAIGVFDLKRAGNLNTFAYVQLTGDQGKPLAVNLSGVQTVRLTALSANNNVNLNFLVFAPAAAVAPALRFASIAASGSAVTINWTGGTPPFQVQKKNSLSDPTWINLLTTSNQSATIPAEGNAGFFRVGSAQP